MKYDIMKDIVAIVLAAGKGTRMKSEVPKVLHEILGKPMISCIIDTLREAGSSDIFVVTGRGKSLLGEVIKDAKVIVQSKLLGSGDAVKSVKKALRKHSGDILVTYGDIPLLRSETVKNLIKTHQSSDASATILTAILKDPTGYGRVVRKDGEKITGIMEEGEARLYEKAISEIKVGLYCFKTKDLFESLDKVRPDNKKKEYFLTDVIGVLHGNGKSIESVEAADLDEIIGVNSRKDLSEANELLKNRILDTLMSNGVTIQDPTTTTIYPDVEIGEETVIYPNTLIERGAEIGASCRIGPFAHLREGVSIGDSVIIGNFVELVRTKVGDGTNIRHKTYLGDTVVGRNVNVGAGTITANFDGKRKNKTVIGDGAFIGVGAVLIAPVNVGKRAIVGAGCVVLKNHDVPKGATVVGVPARILRKRRIG